MKSGLVLLRITGAVLGLQLILGGLLTFGFIEPAAHIITGLILFGLVLATMVAWLLSKPSFRPLRVVSVVLVLLMILQMALGLSTLGSGDQFVAFLHFLGAMAILGVTIAGTFMAVGQASRVERASGEARDQPS